MHRQQFSRANWADVVYQKNFLDRIACELNIKQFSDWYKVTRQEVKARGGHTLFAYYPSLEHALRRIYPQFSWQASQFIANKKAPQFHWQNTQNLMDALHRAEQQLGITQPDDWNSITLADLRGTGFPRRVSKIALADLLKKKYPEYSWDKVYLLRGRFSQQKRLERTIMALFPGESIEVNTRKELKNPESGEFLEIDVFIPSLKLAFEFQERHHYESTEYVNKPVQKIIERDAIKLNLAKEKGITLITVPFWWDSKRSSLIATIRKHRSELLGDALNENESEALPISEEMPSEFANEKAIPSVVDIGQPITACFLTTSSIDPTNWWLFEKYDGIRGFWNPLKNAFFSRLGNQFNFPPEITAAMPSDLFLDGEIWFGRENFTEAIKISNRVDASQIDWSKFKYMVFDIPSDYGSYEERYNMLVNRMGTGNKFIDVAPRLVCKGMAHMEEFFQDVMDKGGEGIILRDPHSKYEAGRSAGYLKHKKYRDGEARVLKAIGNHQWECELPNGVTFTASAGTSEFLRRYNPQPGDIVTFKHRGYLLATKKPKLPTLYRMRHDITWENVVQNWKEQKSTRSVLQPSVKSKKIVQRPKGFWQSEENRKEFFLNFAKEKGFDPYRPENWAQVTIADILAKQGHRLLARYNNSLRKAIEDILGLEFEGESKKPPFYWKDPQNCRKFFDEYAKEKGFDPLDTSSWYLSDLDKMLEKKGGFNIRRQHKGLKQALQKAYQELNFSKWNLQDEEEETQKRKKRTKEWRDKDKLRKFFDEVAREKSFDPTRPENWYSFNLSDLIAKEGGVHIQKDNKGFKNALMEAYPEIHFTRWKTQ